MKKLLGFVFGLGLLAAPTFAADAPKEPIKIGEINSYKAVPLYTENYRRGWTLAVEEINAAGGIHGRKVKVIDRDDLGTPGEALRVAQELTLNEKVDILTGCMFGNICIALGDYAKQNKMPLIRLFGDFELPETQRENDYAFGLYSLFVTARAPAAYLADKHIDVTRWASIAPNYAYGHQAAQIFSTYLAKQNPKVQWLPTYWFPVGKLDAAATIGAIQRKRVDGVFNCSFASDVSQLVRVSTRRGFAKGKTIVSLETGMPESMNTLGTEVPEGWIMTGYPSEQIKTAEHKAFVDRYKKRWGKTPGWMSLNGYNVYKFIFAAMEKAPSLKPQDIVRAMEDGLTIQSPIGKLEMRAADHISTQGIWVGVSHVEKGHPMLKDWEYYPGDRLLIDGSKVNPLQKTTEKKR
ncbi:MAG: ABC transporter substrate-binding protein [Alphaproteobacteria bacterium]|nr:ABC transporter substrate-binding protein [Alphaproteobacteria bacterium]